MANKREREFDTGPTNPQGLTPEQEKRRNKDNESDES